MNIRNLCNMCGGIMNTNEKKCCIFLREQLVLRKELSQYPEFQEMAWKRPEAELHE